MDVMMYCSKCKELRYAEILPYGENDECYACKTCGYTIYSWSTLPMDREDWI